MALEEGTFSSALEAPPPTPCPGQPPPEVGEGPLPEGWPVLQGVSDDAGPVGADPVPGRSGGDLGARLQWGTARGTLSSERESWGRG